MNIVPGQIIYSKLNIAHEHSSIDERMFVVKSVEANGDIVAFPININFENKNLYNSYYVVSPEKENLMRNPIVVVTDCDVEISKDWPIKPLSAKISERALENAVHTQERYGEENDIQLVQSGQPYRNDKRGKEQRLSKLFAEFKENPQVYIEYLKFTGAFSRYSPANAMLLYTQNPHAKYSLTAQGWRKLGYGIKENEKKQSIGIVKYAQRKYITRNKKLVPVIQATPQERQMIFEKQLAVTTKQLAVTIPVFDISQTDCGVNNYAKVMGNKQEVQRQELFYAIRQMAELEGISVEVQDLSDIGLDGHYNKKDNVIYVNEKDNIAKITATLCREYATAFVYNTRSDDLSPLTQEFEARSLTIAIKSMYSLPIDAREQEQLQKCIDVGDKDEFFELEISIQRVGKQINHIEERLSDMVNVHQPLERNVIEMAKQVQENLMQEL